MFKNILLSFFVLFVILLMATASLFSGIKIDNFSYKNISIERFYLKYDKSLHLSAQKILIYNSDKTFHQELSAKIEIENIFNIAHVKIKELSTIDPDLTLIGDVDIEFRNLDFSKKIKLEFTNFSFTFDRYLKDIKTDKTYFIYDKDSIYLEFDNPTYEDVSIKNSQVSIKNLSDDTILYIDIFSRDLIGSPLLNLLKYYEVDLPIRQEYGTNDIVVNIEIPFDEKPIDIKSKIDIKNGKLFAFNRELLIKELKISLDNDLLEANASLKKNNDNKYLKYDLNLTSTIDINTKQSIGNFTIKDSYYDELSFYNSLGNYKLSFQDDLMFDLFFEDNTSFKVSNKEFLLDKLKINYQNDMVTINTDALSKQYPLVISIDEIFSIKKNNLEGTAKIRFKDEQIEVSSNKINYSVDFNDGVDTNISAKNIRGTFYNRDFFITNYEAHYEKDILNSKGLLNDNKGIKKAKFSDTLDLNSLRSFGKLELDYEFNDLSLNSKDIKYKYSYLDGNSIIDLFSSKGEMNLFDQNLSYKNSYVSFFDNNITLKSKILDSNNGLTLDINTTTSLDKKLSQGDVVVDYKYKDILNIPNENFSYDLNFDDTIDLKIPELKLKYSKNKNHHVYIKNMNNIFKHFNGISSEGDGQLYLKTKDFEQIDILVDKLKLKIEKKSFDTNQSSGPQQKIKTPLINLSSKDGYILYDNYNLEYDTFDLNYDDSLTIHLIKDKNILNYKKIDDNITIFSKYLSAEYINNFFNKSYFEKGNIDLSIIGADDNYTGEINIYKSSIKDLPLINNLISFVNTTPAFINPILALPTLIRLSETGFDINSYYVKNGKVNFTYDTEKKYLNLYNIYTDGKMANFKATANIDTNTNRIDSIVNIEFLKDYSKLIKKIPVVGYIIVGDDGKFETVVNVNGDLNNPTITTNTITNAVSGAASIIERTLTLPFQPFLDKKD